DGQSKSTSKDSTSIRDIPLELLLPIFRLSFDINTTGLQRERCRLSLVCRWWRDIVQDSACLWTDISAHDSEAYIEKSLVKSAGLPIDIHYFSPKSRSKRPNVQAYLKLVLKHLPRCRSISIFIENGSFDDLEELLNRLRTAPPPGLESLALKGSGFQRMEVNINWRLKFPELSTFLALRWLEIDGIPCQLAAPGLLVNDFRSLNLIEVHNITAKQLLEALRNSPRLERLGLGRTPRECPSQSAVAPIHLPQLMALHLIFMPVEVSNFFLTIIHAPNCSELFISSHFPKFPGDVVRESLFTSNTDHFSPVMQRLLTRGRYKDIEVFHFSGYSHRGIYFNVRFYDDDSSDPQRSGIFRLEFKLHSIEQVEEAIQWLASHLDRDMPKIPIRLQFDGLGSVPLLKLIDSHMSITHFRYSRGICDSLLIHMGERSTLGWPLQDLEDLVYDPWDMSKSQNETMLDMLRRRYNPSSKKADSGRMLPRPLRRVHVGPCPTPTIGLLVVGEVKEILPQADTSLINGSEKYWTW
ncbi:hypothetical protein FRC01_013175, partial [Tulasnella sp. 417]